VGFNWVDQDLNLSHRRQVLLILESYVADFRLQFASINPFWSMDDAMLGGY